MTNYELLLEHTCPAPIGIETSVGRLDSSTDVKPLLRSQTSVKGLLHDKSADERRQGRWSILPDTTSMLFDSMYWCVRKPFDKGALARGGVITGKDTIV